MRSLSSLSPEERSRVLSVILSSLSFKYYILNKHAFNNTFQSTFHSTFETTSYSDFIFLSDYKQIISDNKENANCAIKQKFLDNSIDLWDSTIDRFSTFYTDDSKMEQQGYAGTATYSPKFGFSFRYRLPSEATVFTAEAWAILQSLILIQDTGYSKAVIFSDSKSVLEIIAPYLAADSPPLANLSRKLFFIFLMIFLPIDVYRPSG